MLELLHQRAAFRFVESETLFGRHVPFLRQSIVFVQLPEGFQYVTAFGAEFCCYVHEFASCMHVASCQDHLELLGQVTREAVAHLDRWAELGGTFRQYIAQIFTGMLASREEKRDLQTIPD